MIASIKFDPASADIHDEVAKTGLHEEIAWLTKSIISELSGRGGGAVKITGSGSGPSGGELRNLKKRMRDRRDREKEDDRRDRKRGGGGGSRDYDKIERQRPRRMLAYALDVTTFEIYVGYSGAANPIVARGHMEGRQRRLDRVNRFTGNFQPVMRYEMNNCAEVAALNVARASGALIQNLFFIALHSDGRFRNPCGNCIQWITAFARGYWRV